ncbi:acetylornithine/succinylornithine family transaminase [Leptolyngbya sp. FACHB-261]|uniref:aspartate aminotransferase family protein n=1 Tax=Leptolyngbya sp. FACHB-261 TaxID=2692806 RepID=UPI001681F358|nr:aspartate aminotransferase family protein [Leptolyngbya sp. FACHB-261]
MSPEALVQPVSLQPTAQHQASTEAEQFDAHVMTTYARFPVVLERGEGCRVWDTEGREYLDFVAGIATCALGHAHPALIDAVSQQMRKLHHVSNLYYIPEQGQLAQWLVEHSCADRAFFCNSGAEANEAAIKLARKYAHIQRGISEPVIITALASFHGRTLATITATGQPKYQKNFDPLMPGFHYVPYNDLAALEAAVEALEGRVCAILLEALQGEGGVRPGDRAYFQRIRELCNEKGILLILDEVQVGMGRSGKLWGYENLGIEPDIFTSAKALGGGVPIGAMLCKEFCNVFGPGDHASTFGGNPLACAAGLCVAQTLVSDGLIENAAERGAQLQAGLNELVSRFPNLLDHARGWGLIQGLVLKEDNGLTAPALVKTALEQGLLLVPAGPKVVRFVPPLIVTAEEIDRALTIVAEALTAIV